jgi:hypothetical protein
MPVQYLRCRCRGRRWSRDRGVSARCRSRRRGRCRCRSGRAAGKLADVVDVVGNRGDREASLVRRRFAADPAGDHHPGVERPADNGLAANQLLELLVAELPLMRHQGPAVVVAGPDWPVEQIQGLPKSFVGQMRHVEGHAQPPHFPHQLASQGSGPPTRPCRGCSGRGHSGPGRSPAGRWPRPVRDSSVRQSNRPLPATGHSRSAACPVRPPAAFAATIDVPSEARAIDDLHHFPASSIALYQASWPCVWAQAISGACQPGRVLSGAT